MRALKIALKVILGLVLVLVVTVAVMVLTLTASIPEQHFKLEPRAATDDGRPVLIFGATRNTGFEVAKLLAQRGQRVTAAVRPSSDRSLAEGLGVNFVVADAMDAEAVHAAVASADFQAIITTIGCFRCEPPPDYIGNRNIIDAAKANGVSRVILITTIGTGESAEYTNLLSRLALSKILPLKEQAEDYLRASGLGFTIIRPGGLLPNDKPSTGNGQLYDDVSTFGFIHRRDLAEVIVAALDDDRTIGKTLAAVDPGVNRPF